MVMMVTALRDFRFIKYGIPKIPLRSTVIEHLKEHTSVSDNEGLRHLRRTELVDGIFSSDNYEP